MECNKEEALRAKQIAEARMQRDDFSGALRFAQKALRLFPELENMSQLVAVCEVHCSAQKKVIGTEADWYAVLKVEKTADEITLKKQFRKLALLLHPDKNKLPGAEAAFKFIGEANRVLSDREARSLYDKKCRNLVVSPTSQSQKPKAQPKCPGAKNHNGTRKKPESVPNFPTQGHDTSGKVHGSNGYQQDHLEMWTCCSSCHTRQKSLKLFIGKTMHCQSCGTAFTVQELRTQDSGLHSQHGQTKFSNVELSRPDVPNKGASSSGTKFEETIHSADGVKGTGGATQKGKDTGQDNPIPEMDGAYPFGRASPQKQRVFAKKNSIGEDHFVNHPKRARNDGTEPMDEGRGSPHEKHDPDPENDEAEGLFEYPDPEFSDFDKLRSVFAADQVWACYDNINGMPRFYALIKKVISPGFKLRFIWLESLPKSEVEVDWSLKELPVACGYYRTGGTEEGHPKLFSHQIHCVKMPRKPRGRLVCYMVYPRKGEIWAIFKNWDINWASDPQKHIPYRYEYVEVLSDFDEDSGVKVGCLHKVRGFVSLYRRVDGGNGVEDTNGFYQISPDEKYRFSHRVPSFIMTGAERSDVPPGSFELDPASLDPEELQDSLEKENAEVRVHDTELESKSTNTMANSSESPGPKLNPQPGRTRLDPLLSKNAREENKERNSCSTVGGGSNNVSRPGASCYSEPDIPPKQDPAKSEKGSHVLRRSPRGVSKS